MTHPIKLKDAVQIQLGYHLLREAGWQSGHAAVCNTVYAGSIPTPASNFSSLHPQDTTHKNKDAARYQRPCNLFVVIHFWLFGQHDFIYRFEAEVTA